MITNSQKHEDEGQDMFLHSDLLTTR